MNVSQWNAVRATTYSIIKSIDFCWKHHTQCNIEIVENTFNKYYRKILRIVYMLPIIASTKY